MQCDPIIHRNIYASSKVPLCREVGQCLQKIGERKTLGSWLGCNNREAFPTNRNIRSRKSRKSQTDRCAQQLCSGGSSGTLDPKVGCHQGCQVVFTKIRMILNILSGRNHTSSFMENLTNSSQIPDFCKIEPQTFGIFQTNLEGWQRWLPHIVREMETRWIMLLVLMMMTVRPRLHKPFERCLCTYTTASPINALVGWIGKNGIRRMYEWSGLWAPGKGH